MTTPPPADPKPGELWRHWTGGLCTVLEICRATWDADLRLVAYDVVCGAPSVVMRQSGDHVSVRRNGVEWSIAASNPNIAPETAARMIPYGTR